MARPSLPEGAGECKAASKRADGTPQANAMVRLARRGYWLEAARMS